MASEINIRLSAVIVAAAAKMVIGAAWYSPKAWGAKWVALMGRSDKELRPKHVSRAYGWTFATALVVAYFLAHCVAYMQAVTLAYGALVGAWVWLGFVATTSLSTYLFDGRPLALYAINQGYELVIFMVMGAILAVMR